MHANLHIFLEGKNDQKNLSQISKFEHIKIKSAWKEALHNTSRSLEMELWRLKVHVQEAFCILRMRNYFLFMIVVSYDLCVVWGRERCHFSQSAISCAACEQFCPGRTVHFDDFYLTGKH